MEGQRSNLHGRTIMDTKTIGNYQYKVNQETSWKDRMKKVLRMQEQKPRQLYADALHTSAPPVTKKWPASLIPPEQFNAQAHVAHKKFEPKVFNGTTDADVFSRDMKQHLNTLTNTSNFKKALVWLSYMRGPEVKEWVKKVQYVVKLKLQLGDFKGENDPAIWPWFKQHFNLKYKQGENKNIKVTRALLKLQMKRGNVEGYIKQFEVLRKSASWSEDKQGTILQFRCGLGSMHNREVCDAKVQRPVTLQDWYKHACNQWKGDSTSPIQVNMVLAVPKATKKLQMSSSEVARWRQVLGKKSSIATSTTNINVVLLTPEVKAKGRLQMSDSEKACWRQALLKNKNNAYAARIDTVSQLPIPAVRNKTIDDSEIIRWRQALTGRKSTVEGKKRTLDKQEVVATQPQCEQPQQPAVTSKEKTTTDQITWT